MTRRTCLIAIAALLPLAALRTTPALAQDGYVLIVNEANPVTTLTRQQAADIFMKRTTQWPHGGDTHPVDQPAMSPIRDVFSRAVHGKPAAAVASWWGQQVFNGRATPPPQRPTDRAVVTFVREDALAIGYVAPGQAPPDVKQVRITP